MLTSLSPRLLHAVRSAAAYVHDLAQLGLDLLCPCEEGHGERLRQLETAPGCPPQVHHGVDCPGDACRYVDDLGANGMAERCYLPGCPGWVTGASDYCSPRCAALALAHAEARA